MEASAGGKRRRRRRGRLPVRGGRGKTIKWRKQRTTNPTGREKEIVEEGEEEEIGREEKAEAQENRDAETAGLIREYQMNVKPTQETMEIL